MTIFQFSFGDGFAGSAKIALLSSVLLREKGHSLFLFVSEGSLTEKRGMEYGLNCISLNTTLKYKYLKEKIFQLYKLHRPDVVIGHHSLDRKIGISIKRKFPECINIAYRHNITKSVPVIGSFIYNMYTDYLIACSGGVAKSLIDSGIRKNKVVTLYNGIPVPENIDNISGNAVRRQYNTEGKTVLGLSTWFHKERKGFDILFKAFSGLDEKFILLLVGIPAAQQNEVKEYAASFGISPEKLVMPGYVENIWEFYKAMDIFLLPSRSEGFSLALLEAAASELPVIASDIPGNNEFIEDGRNGLLFSTDHPEILREKIVQLSSDKSLGRKYAYEAKKKVLENFTIEKYADNLNRFLESAAGKKLVR